MSNGVIDEPTSDILGFVFMVFAWAALIGLVIAVSFRADAQVKAGEAGYVVGPLGAGLVFATLCACVLATQRSVAVAHRLESRVMAQLMATDPQRDPYAPETIMDIVRGARASQRELTVLMREHVLTMTNYHRTIREAWDSYATLEGQTRAEALRATTAALAAADLAKHAVELLEAKR